MNDMLALATAYLALIALLIGHSIHTSRRLKLVEEPVSYTHLTLPTNREV